MKMISTILAVAFFISSPLTVAESYSKNNVKNVILMIGDGMGPQQLGLLFSYAKFAPDSIYKGQPTAIEQFMKTGVTGLSLTSPADKVVVDSACSATQLATGVVSGSEMIGVDADGNPVETVLELARKRGKATGLVSDTRLTHATPAAFASHQPHRSLENEIAVEMLQQNIDVMLSGGLRHWLPANINNQGSLYQELLKKTGDQIQLKSNRKDNLNLLQMAEKSGYELVFNREQLAAANGPVLGLFSHSGMADGITHSQHKNNAERTEPTLKEMTAKALELLSTNPEGFFLMVEGGQIDWAGHANDVGTMLHEMIKFDETVAAVQAWATQRNDTIIILTADHETGGFGFSYSNYQIPKGKPLSGAAFNNRLFKPKFNFIDRAVLSRIYEQNKSYSDISDKIAKLPKDKQAADKVRKIVYQNTGFSITEQEAISILGSTDEHGETGFHIHDFEAFYVYPNRFQSNLIGRALAKYQGVTWGTGTHTATPVTVTIVGPSNLSEAVNGINSHSEIGRLLKQWVDIDQKSAD